MGFGLLEHAPMSDERRQAFDREEERERKAAEVEEQARRDAAIERRWELQRQGYEPQTVGDVLARASFGQDRADAAEAKRVKAGDELRGAEREPRLDKYGMLKDAREREAAKETTAASQADLAKVAGKVGSLQSAVNLLKRRRP
jgi:hypothetical protein